MSDRGMKKWAPFSSLIEQSIVLKEMYYEKHKSAKPSISSERAEKINRIFMNYQGQELDIKYFYDGYVYTLTTRLKRIDATNRKIILEEGSIPFSEIIDVDIAN